MKVQQDMRNQLDTARKSKHKTAPEKQSFQHLVQSQARMLEEQSIQQKMNDISRQGDRLARFRTFREMATFKRLVKAFMHEVVKDGLDLYFSHSFQLDGGNRKLLLVKEVDGKLVELTDEMMQQEQKTVDLLGVIGEIKGLLVDMSY